MTQAETNLKPGTRIEVGCSDIAGRRVWEAARIIRRTKVMGPPEAGWHPIRFDADGARLMCHEGGFRVVSA